MDEDWRGLDTEWLLRVSERLMERLDALERGVAPDDPEETDEIFEEVRICIEALGARAVRPVMLSVDSDGPLLDDDRAQALASEFVGARHGTRWLSFEELMGAFPDEPAEGVALVGRLLLLGFHRREYPAFGVTHRYYCRSGESRSELREQMMAWLSSEG